MSFSFVNKKVKYDLTINKITIKDDTIKIELNEDSYLDFSFKLHLWMLALSKELSMARWSLLYSTYLT